MTMTFMTHHCVSGDSSLTFIAFAWHLQTFPGEVSERSKEHAWKVCVRHKRTEGSNPSLSATQSGL